ncbi:MULTISPECIES: AAA family ATPase [unclassified Candidatus Frackibacter]|uniref:AAA family ATPase n=1 Tax=unclassified Candidatus Frackibacter TaxID=2648818 RepID=UPI00088C0D73|nr:MULTISPECIES: AAA family ATPase [unclassified Candidatus Frackibacter]SDC64721.1 putative ATPase [Candidatus Frackibacter sp. WG11]SEM77266.1 putative ATPase [Candidatus Frackibacter sp. WG12]SFL88818.1 putative ATPase [Candidatus Frackibacter sp. WG13]
MDLFTHSAQDEIAATSPLADRMRPRSLDEFIGQSKIVGEGKLLRRAIQADRLQSLIFYGPPGTGKTTLAMIIANTTSSEFEKLNAVTSGVKDIRRVIKQARERKGMYQQQTILFIDEIHRFNKSQQDALLPAVEKGTIILIGATTENPYFEVNSPLVSRSRIFQLELLKREDLKQILLNALKDETRGLGEYKVHLKEEALEHIIDVAGGDARSALNALELAVLTTPTKKDGVKDITIEVAEESIQQRSLDYDQAGDNHYDTVSAFIKSMRGSDPDATLYWLAKMLEAGEDPRFIARRMIVHAAEDVGIADPQALVIANAAADAVEYVGLPEARIPLAEAAVYIATAPKSNAIIRGIDKAISTVRNQNSSGIPDHLRDAHYKGAKKLGHGKGYKYPYHYQDNYVEQQYLPDELVKEEFYHPGDQGYEEEIKQFWLKVGNKKKD